MNAETSTPKRILISGGSGLIGKPLAANLANAGYEVITLSRNPAATANELPAGVRAHKWDARSAEGWAHLAEGAHAIINLAGESIAGTGALPSRWSAERKRRIHESRVYAGLAVVDAIAAAEVKPQVLIQASAVGYYGQTTGDAILDEDSPAGRDYMGQVGQAWEKSTAPVEEMGVRRAIARTGVVQSLEGGPLPFSLFQFKMMVGGKLGSGNQWMSWIHMQDQINALRFLLENESANGPFNLTAPEPVTNKEFTRMLGRVTNRPSLMFVPEVAMRIALGEVATLVLDGQRVLPKRLLELGFKFQYPTLFYALRNLVK